jgi:hypothetical protein
LKCVSKGDYQQYKGIRSEQKIPTYKIQGFRKFDKVKYLGKEYFIKGRMSSGFCVLMDIEENKIEFKNGSVILPIENDNKVTRGKRSQILLVPDSKEYYKGIKIIQWYYYELIGWVKSKINKEDK